MVLPVLTKRKVQKMRIEVEGAFLSMNIGFSRRCRPLEVDRKMGTYPTYSRKIIFGPVILF